MSFLDFVVLVVLASGALAASKLIFRRLDRVFKYRKKNFFYGGIILVFLGLYVYLVTPFFHPLMPWFLSPVIIILSVCLGLFLYDFYRIHRRTNFSIKKYFSKLPENPRRVTAVIPNYNYAEFINERIDSIVNQKYPVYELIVLDDCSTDDSVKVIEKRLEELKDTHPNLKTRFIKNKKNSGNVFNQWAKAFKYASGDFVWICEADDLCSPYFLKQVMLAFEKDKKVILSYAESDMIDEKKRRKMANHKKWIDYDRSGHWRRSYINDGKAEIRDYLAINNTITNVSGVVFRNQKNIPFVKYLNDATKYRLAGDWYFYSKILLYGNIAYNAESLNHYRSHTGSVSKTTDNLTHYKEIVFVQESIAKDVKLPSKTKQVIEFRRESLQDQWHLSSDLIYYDTIDLDKLCSSHHIKDEIIFSVIIPVYNVAKYLPKCLDSVLIDLPEKAEIILVNDGSTDNSLEVCKEYAKQDKRIKIIDQKNGGLSSARNAGLEIARGRFLALLASDDFMERYAYPTMLKKLISEGSDLVHCDIALYHNPEEIIISKMENVHHPKNQRLLRLMDVPLAPTCANKVYKRELFNGIRFPVGKNNEDNAVVPLVVANCNKISYIPIPFYNYVQREGSIQHKAFSKDRFVIFDTIKLCLSQISDKRKFEIVSGTLTSHQIIALLVWVIIEEKNPKRNEYIRLFCEKYHDLPVSRDNRYVKEYLKLHKLPKLLDLIYAENSNPNRIRRYIRCGRTIESNIILRHLPFHSK